MRHFGERLVLDAALDTQGDRSPIELPSAVRRQARERGNQQVPSRDCKELALARGQTLCRSSFSIVR